MSEFVIERRKEVNHTQREFAERTSVALTIVPKLVQGKTNLNMEKVNLILRMLGHNLKAIPTKELESRNTTDQ